MQKGTITQWAGYSASYVRDFAIPKGNFGGDHSFRKCTDIFIMKKAKQNAELTTNLDYVVKKTSS